MLLLGMSAQLVVWLCLGAALTESVVMLAVLVSPKGKEAHLVVWLLLALLALPLGLVAQLVVSLELGRLLPERQSAVNIACPLGFLRPMGTLLSQSFPRVRRLRGGSRALWWPGLRRRARWTTKLFAMTLRRTSGKSARPSLLRTCRRAKVFFFLLA